MFASPAPGISQNTQQPRSNCLCQESWKTVGNKSASSLQLMTSVLSHSSCCRWFAKDLESALEVTACSQRPQPILQSCMHLSNPCFAKLSLHVRCEWWRVESCGLQTSGHLAAAKLCDTSTDRDALRNACSSERVGTFRQVVATQMQFALSMSAASAAFVACQRPLLLSRRLRSPFAGCLHRDCLAPHMLES